MDIIIKKVKTVNYYDDLYNIPRELYYNKPIKPKHYKGINIALLNIPCGGFGDVITCKTIYDYFNKWYKGSNIYICTNDIDKFKTINEDVKNMIKLKEIRDDDCHSFYNLKMTTKVKFDIFIIVPVAKRTFYIKELQSMIPYATYFNTFTVSEYNNDLLGPYTFPTGIGKHNIGLLLNKIKIPKQTIIQNPFAVIYIQSPELTGVHGNYCFLAFIEMISKKYTYKKFQVIIPEWIVDIIRCYLEEPQSGTCYTINRRLRDYTSNYPNLYMIDNNKKKYIVKNGCSNDNTMILRGDILPKPRKIFISLIKDSIPDVLLTGDQSVTDALSCCSNKVIWYQIAPWKKDFAIQMSKHIPNKYLRSYKTSCGTIKGIDNSPNYDKIFNNYDFRINGKAIMDSIILANYYKEYELFKSYINVVNHSNSIESVIKKLLRYKNTIK